MYDFKSLVRRPIRAFRCLIGWHSMIWDDKQFLGRKKGDHSYTPYRIFQMGTCGRCTKMKQCWIGFAAQGEKNGMVHAFTPDMLEK